MAIFFDDIEAPRIFGDVRIEQIVVDMEEIVN
jgi:hypothetical protein